MLAGRTRDEVVAIYRAREPYYRQADVTVDTTRRTTDQVVAEILRALRVRSCPPPEEGRPRPAVPSPLITRLAERPLLCDGAMGTMLYARGVPLDACFDVLNLNEPKMVQSIHAEYIQAGVGPDRDQHLRGQPLQARAVTACRAGCARSTCVGRGSPATCARAWAATCSCWAPSGRSASTWRRSAASSRTRRALAFREQAEGLLEGGVDAFVDRDVLRPHRDAAGGARRCGRSADLPIVAEVAFTDDGVTFTGRSAPPRSSRALRELPVQVVGANCSVGSSVLYDILEQMLPEAGGLHLVSSSPTRACRAGWASGSSTSPRPAYMADYAARMIVAGARMVGGCCGTTPQHVRAMREALDRLVPERHGGAGDAGAPRRGRRPRSPPASPPRRRRPLARSGGSRRASSLVTVELDPPRGPQHREARAGREAAQGARGRDRRHQRRLARARADVRRCRPRS